MRFKSALALLLLFKLNDLFAQQIDLMPYIGLNNNITNLVLQMQTTSVAEGKSETILMVVSFRLLGSGCVVPARQEGRYRS